MVSSVTEHEQWVVSHENKPDREFLGSQQEALDYCKELNKLGDPDWTPTKITHVVEHLERTVTETNVPLPGVQPEHILAVLTDDIIKLGGMAPQGAKGVEWVVRRTLALQKELEHG